MASPSIQRIERLNYGLAAILILGSLVTQSKPIALGVTVGSLLTCLNFFALRRLIMKWTSEAAVGKHGNTPLLMLPKMVGLMVSVVLALMFLPIDPVAFTIGYSTFIVSIILDTTFSALRPPTNESDEKHG